MNSRPRFPEDPTRFEAVDWATAEALRKMTPQERLQIGFQLHEAVRNMIFEHLRASNPTWSEEAVERELCRRLLGMPKSRYDKISPPKTAS